ncbi:MAG: hypothetical protein QW650_01200 [Thermofilum sp.]
MEKQIVEGVVVKKGKFSITVASEGEEHSEQELYFSKFIPIEGYERWEDALESVKEGDYVVAEVTSSKGKQYISTLHIEQQKEKPVQNLETSAVPAVPKAEPSLKDLLIVRMNVLEKALTVCSELKPHDERQLRTYLVTVMKVAKVFEDAVLDGIEPVLGRLKGRAQGKVQEYSADFDLKM